MAADHERLFVAEHRLPRITEAELELLRAALVEACARVTARRSRVRYVRSTFLPGRERLLSCKTVAKKLTAAPKRAYAPGVAAGSQSSLSMLTNVPNVESHAARLSTTENATLWWCQKRLGALGAVAHSSPGSEG